MAIGPRGQNAINLPFYAAFACTVASFLLDFMAFSSPYWLESYPETNSRFLRMGLWNACFDRFIHPRDTHANVWTGCYWIFNWNFWNKGIWEWLNPRWLIGVQVIYSLGFICHCIATLCLILYFVVVGSKLAEAGTAFVCQLMSVIFIFVGILIFGIKHDDRYWMARPDFNHLSWSYAFAVLSCFLSIFAAIFCYMVFKHHQKDDYDGFQGKPQDSYGPGPAYGYGAGTYGGQPADPYAAQYGQEQAHYASLQHGATSPGYGYGGYGYDPNAPQEPQGGYGGYGYDPNAPQDPQGSYYRQDPPPGSYRQEPAGGYPGGSYRQEPSGSYRQDPYGQKPSGQGQGQSYA